jgi:flagellar basal body-associated protein FliL
MQLAQALAKLCQILLSRLIVSFVVTMVVVVVVTVVVLAVVMRMVSQEWQPAQSSIALKVVPSPVCCPLSEFLTAPKPGLYNQKQR